MYLDMYDACVYVSLRVCVCVHVSARVQGVNDRVILSYAFFLARDSFNLSTVCKCV